MTITDTNHDVAIPRSATFPHLTDLGNAARLAERHGKDLRYVGAEDSWYVYDERSGSWRRDETGEIIRRASETILMHHREALTLDDDMRVPLIKHFLRSESAAALRNMISLCQATQGVSIRPSDFDRDPNLLCVGNGVLDLRSGVLSPHSRSGLHLRHTAVPFDPKAQCPRWERFLGEVCEGNHETLCFLRRALGYALTGHTKEHAAFFPFGLGANGKSVLLETIRHVLGTYAASADVATFLERDADDGRPRNDLARLVGVRFVTAVEPNEGSRLSEGFLKSITGGDVVTARFLFKEFFEFPPQFKVWLATNHRPAVRGTDEGIWRRIRIIPFNATFRGDACDPNLIDALRAESSGILRFLAEAAVEWEEKGLGSAPAVAEATSSYRQDQDVVGRFLAEACELEPHFSETADRLYRAYRGWCEAQGERPWSAKALGMRLSERGLRSTRTAKARVWQGIHVASADDELPGFQ